MRRIAAVLVLALLVGSCGSNVPAPGQSAALGSFSVPMATPQPTSATWTIDQAAMYLKIVAPFNKVTEQANKAKPTLKAQKKARKSAAAAADRFLEGLKAIAWPTEVAGKADALINAQIVFQAKALQASNAKTLDQLDLWARDAQKADSKAASAAAPLRDALGLPPPGA